MVDQAGRSTAPVLWTNTSSSFPMPLLMPLLAAARATARAAAHRCRQLTEPSPPCHRLPSKKPPLLASLLSSVQAVGAATLLPPSWQPTDGRHSSLPTGSHTSPVHRRRPCHSPPLSPTTMPPPDCHGYHTPSPSSFHSIAQAAAHRRPSSNAVDRAAPCSPHRPFPPLFFTTGPRSTTASPLLPTTSTMGAAQHHHSRPPITLSRRRHPCFHPAPAACSSSPSFPLSPSTARRLLLCHQPTPTSATSSSMAAVAAALHPPIVAMAATSSLPSPHGLHHAAKPTNLLSPTAIVSPSLPAELPTISLLSVSFLLAKSKPTSTTFFSSMPITTPPR